MKTLIAQGAEAKIYRITEGGTNPGIILKERVPKEYRIKILDEKIRKQRTKREASILFKAEKIINVPHMIHSEDYEILMEFIDGKKLAEHLDNFNEKERLEICGKIGKEVAILHNNNIIHGDLTTSNMLLKDDKVYFIDFGLSFIDENKEHKAVDLHLLRQAIESKHYKHFETSFREIIKSYGCNSDNSKEILKRFVVVEGRGRYKNKKK